MFIDDATSELMALRFALAETTQAYMETLRAYLAQHGRSVAPYSDKHSIFRVNHPDHEGELTQFTRALRTLGIEPSMPIRHRPRGGSNGPTRPYRIAWSRSCT